MKKRFYIVKQSDYPYNVALVSGPKSPALSTMRRKFDQTFNAARPTNRLSVVANYLDRLDWRSNLIGRLQLAGLSGNTVPELFLDWLFKQEAGFAIVPYADEHFE